MSNRRKIPSVDLLTTGVTATTYGSATAVPVITVNAQGQITSATTASVSPDATLTVRAAATLAADDLVYVSSYNVADAANVVDFADADAPSKAAVWVVDAAIASGSTGTVSKRKLSAATLNTNGSSVGDPVYLSTTATTGNTWTLTPPTGADQIQQIVGRVVVVSATVGQIQFDTLDAYIIKAGTSFIQTSVGLTTPKITTSINDANGNESLRIAATASAVNEFTVTNAAAGNGVTILATGDDTNISAQFGGKGNGAVVLGQATSTGVNLAADQPIRDSSGNEFIAFSKTASAVNEVTVTNAATGNRPKIAATGGDTNIGLDISGKGTGGVTLWSADGTEELLILTDGGAPAVNEVTIRSAATGAAPSILASGGDTNVGITLRAKGDGAVNLDSTATGGVLLTNSQPLLDANSNELLKFAATGSATNELTIANAANGSPPSVTATGSSDANVDIRLVGKGTGKVIFGLNGASGVAGGFTVLDGANPGSTLVTVVSTKPQITLGATGTSGGISVLDTAAGAESVQISGTNGAINPHIIVGTSSVANANGKILFKDGGGTIAGLLTVGSLTTSQKTYTLPNFTGTVLCQENSSPSTGNVVAGSATVTSGGNTVTVNVGTQFNGKPVLLSIATDSAGAYVGAGVSMIVIGTVAAGTLTIQVRDAITGNTANVSKNVAVFYMISAV